MEFTKKKKNRFYGFDTFPNILYRTCIDIILKQNSDKGHEHILKIDRSTLPFLKINMHRGTFPPLIKGLLQC